MVGNRRFVRRLMKKGPSLEIPATALWLFEPHDAAASVDPRSKGPWKAFAP